MITKLPHYALLQVQGPEACSFLQEQLTCNVKNINEKKASLAAYCNAKGRVMASMCILYYAESYFLILSADLLEATFQRLSKYAAFSQVNLQPADEHWLCLGAMHKPSESMHPLIMSLFPTQPSNFLKAVSTTHGQIVDANPSPKISIKRYWMLLDKRTYPSEIQQDLDQALTQGHTLWQTYTIQEGLADITTTTQGLFTPHKMNLHKLGAIDFNKGCFVGQEVIARTENLGRRQNYLYQAALRLPRNLTPPQPGDMVINKAISVGYVVNTAITQQSSNTSKEYFTIQLLLILHPHATTTTTSGSQTRELYLKQHPQWPLQLYIYKL